MNMPVVTKQIFRDGEEYFLVEVRADGRLSLKRKVYGWGETWSLPINEENV